MVSENYGIFGVIRFDSFCSLSLLSQEFLVVGGFEIGIGLLFEIVEMGSHFVFAFLHVFEGIWGDLFPIVEVLVGGVDIIRVIRAQIEMMPP